MDHSDFWSAESNQLKRTCFYKVRTIFEKTGVFDCISCLRVMNMSGSMIFAWKFRACQKIALVRRKITSYAACQTHTIVVTSNPKYCNVRICIKKSVDWREAEVWCNTELLPSYICTFCCLVIIDIDFVSTDHTCNWCLLAVEAMCGVFIARKTFTLNL